MYDKVFKYIIYILDVKIREFESVLNQKTHEKLETQIESKIITGTIITQYGKQNNNSQHKV